jgi:thiol-disulfide isomerase/thioredoxin
MRLLRAVVAFVIVAVGATGVMFVLAAGDPSAIEQAAAPAAASADAPPADWLERLPPDDRRFVDELRGSPPPAFTGDLAWYGSSPPAWSSLRGSVVVLQSWTSRTEAGRAALERAIRALSPHAPADARLIALHTPEGAADAATFIERHKLAAMIAVDAGGAFCDALGVYKRPANIVVDRSGLVRYAGLNARGLTAAVEKLIAEPFDAAAAPPAKRPAAAPTGAEFPPHNRGVGGARDLQGQPAPAFAVDQWLTPQVDVRNRVLVLDFWATWCPPCRATIPHMNDLARRFGNDAAFIGISAEKSSAFQSGLKKYRLTLDSFAYALALDPYGAMARPIGIQGIPHCVVIGSDGVIRWQGHPGDLKEGIVAAIIAADQRQRGGAGGPGGGRRNRWQAG